MLPLICHVRLRGVPPKVLDPVIRGVPVVVTRLLPWRAGPNEGLKNNLMNHPVLSFTFPVQGDHLKAVFVGFQPDDLASSSDSP